MSSPDSSHTRSSESNFEHRRLALISATLPELEVRYAIAEEGYRLIQEAACKARAEANKQETKARLVYETLKRRLDSAREAEAELKRLLPNALLEPWEAAHDQVLAARLLRDEGKRHGRNTEHVEAAIETLEHGLRQARQAALGSIGGSKGVDVEEPSPS